MITEQICIQGLKRFQEIDYVFCSDGYWHYRKYPGIKEILATPLDFCQHGVIYKEKQPGFLAPTDITREEIYDCVYHLSEEDVEDYDGVYIILTIEKDSPIFQKALNKIGMPRLRLVLNS